MGLAFIAPLFLAGLLALAIPVIVHLIRRHQGKRIDFPSLMFLRQMPVRSVRRLRIRDWFLLMLRALALALIVLAFARPVLRLGATDEVVEDGLREVVIALDRSWSMERGDRWERALDEARSVLADLVSPDRVSLVVFDGVGQVVVEPTLEPGRVRAALDTLSPGWGRTQIGAGIQAASGLVEPSERSRKEVVLISDFQRRGWEDGPRDRLPAGTQLTPVDVGDDGIGTLIVADVELEHTFFEGRQRIRPEARVVRQGAGAPTQARVVLEMDGREIETHEIEIPSEGAVPVAFEPITLPEEGVRGAILLFPEGAPPEEPFRFFFSPREVLSILIAEGSVSGPAQGAYLRSALAVTGGTPVTVETRTGNGFTVAELEAADVVILNDVPLSSGASGNLLREYVLGGGGVVIVAGPESAPGSWENAWADFLPGRLGDAVDRNPARGGTLTAVDRDHPVFSPFAGSEGGGLGGPRFYRYRALSVPLPPDPESPEGQDAAARGPQVIARFDDGTPALAEQTVGSGRVLVWTSTLDNTWTDFALHPAFVPVTREMARYASSREERVPYFAVGQPLDVRFLLGQAGVPGASAEEAGGGGAGEVSEGLLIGPGATGVELRTGAGQLVQLPTPGFYEVRLGDDAGPVVRTVAANPELREADPTRMDPEELVVAVSGTTGTAAAQGGDSDLVPEEGPGQLTPEQESERRQGAWRFLLLGAILLLLCETLVAARSKPLAKQATEA